MVVVGVVIALVVALGGCSSEPDESVATTVPISAAPTTDGVTAVPAPTTVEGAEAAPAAPRSIAIDVAVEAAGIDERLFAEFTPGETDELDPFARFGSCSGLGPAVGTYVVTLVDPDADVRSVTVVTSDRVGAPGIHAADVRVEFPTGEPMTASGTMTIEEDLRSGTFEAFDPAGGVVSGSFACDGPGEIAVPLDDSVSVDGDLRGIEVVALLRRDDAERIVALTLDTSRAGSVVATCPAVAGTDEPVLVSVVGEPSLGSIDTFELVAEPSPTLTMSVGGSVYEFTDVVVDVESVDAAGTFSGSTVDGVEVDGAYRCS